MLGLVMAYMIQCCSTLVKCYRHTPATWLAQPAGCSGVGCLFDLRLDLRVYTRVWGFLGMGWDSDRLTLGGSLPDLLWMTKFFHVLFDMKGCICGTGASPVQVARFVCSSVCVTFHSWLRAGWGRAFRQGTFLMCDIFWALLTFLCVSMCPDEVVTLICFALL
jgi:hypothetical protein